MAYEAFYRRYRPSRFADAFFGQEHIVAALRNAVEGDRVGHAYLFSGPRGTGKTTSARILAKALNCTNLQGGEPCDECDSCLAFQAGGSYDLHELDAASNNGVEAMRDLIGKVALGSPGRTKVYILDEVHMLSSGAENALLKTLEEPPPHVVFVLCTTEPNKVVPTIRSRTQHLEFSLLNATQVGELIDYVVGDAQLEISPEDRAYVIRAGGGSARDSLSALDQVVAAGGAPQGGEHLEALFQSLIDRDSGAALSAIDGALHAGRDAASIATALLHELRGVFLAAMRADLAHMPEAEQQRATERAAAMPPARATRAIEVIGTSIIDMRQAPDPRVDLEVALMRLTRTDLDTDPAALLERIEAIEQHAAGGAPMAAPTETVAPAAQPAAAVPQQAPVQEAQAPAVAEHAPVDSAPPQQQETPPQPAPSQEAPQATPQQQEPQQATPPQPAPSQEAPQAAPPQTGGARGADIVRAALAEQGITSPGSRPAPAPAAPAAPAAESAGDGSAPAAGKTLADVRRERQAAAQATGATAAQAEVVAANTDARRERQAAAQTSHEEVAPAPASAPEVAAAPEPAPAAHEAAAPARAPAPAPAAEPAPAPAPAAAPQVEPAAQAPSQQAPVQQAPAQETQAPAPAPVAAQPPAGGALPTMEELQGVWQGLLETMSGRVRSRFSAGHFLETTADSVIIGLPNSVHRDRCEEIRDEVDTAFASTFGRPIPLTLVVDMVEEEPDFFNTPPSGGAGAIAATDEVPEEDTVDVHDLVDATGDVPSAQDRVMATFEGSILLEDPQNPPLDR